MPPLAIVLVCLCLFACNGDDDGKKNGKSPSPFKPTATIIEQHNRAVGLMGQFNFDEALKAFTSLTDKHPSWHEARVNLAIATLNRQREGDSEKALTILDDVLKHDKSNIRAKYCSGILNLHAGKADKALSHFLTVATADPDDAYAAYFTGQCLFEQSKYADAQKQFARAIELDPYLRSAYYGAFQVLQRLDKSDEAKSMLDTFQKLDSNPQARLAEIKYTRMGPKSEAIAIDLNDNAPAKTPDGALFAEPIPLPIANGDDLKWRRFVESKPPNLTICDIDSDGKLDLFIARAFEGDAANAVLIQNDSGFEIKSGHPLASVSNINAALWGDYDNDGLTDVYLLRDGHNQLWKQVKASEWNDVTPSTKTAGEPLESVDGAIFDADHDGDLDLFVVNLNGPNELFSNNLDGTFRPLAESQGLGGGDQTHRVVVADLDNDRDLDIYVISAFGIHELHINDRLWSYRNETYKRGTTLAVAVDLRADGNRTIKPFPAIGQPPGAKHVFADIDGDGDKELIVSRPDGWGVKGDDKVLGISTDGPCQWTLANLDPGKGPSVIAVATGQAPRIWKPGPGRHAFALVSFSGKQDKAESMRSNASGIGVSVAARIGSRWQTFDTIRANSGPGQSLQPLAIGLAGASKIDFISMNWPDGLLQSELALSPGTLHRIKEKQRQTSSCPVVFVWNGTEYQFVTDILGVGGVGFFIEPGQYAPPRPIENLLLPNGLLKAHNGRMRIKIGEPMQEACYLDHAQLVAYDLPPGWKMTMDERMGIAGPAVTSSPVFYRKELLPVAATNDRGEDVVDLIRTADHKAAPVGEIDHRFIGRTKEHSVTVQFDQAVDQLSRPVLMIDGWLEYPYSQTMFAAWQASADYRAPTLEARGAEGQWKVVLEQFGYPAGFPRQMSVPLDQLPRGTNELRLTTNQEIYWDRIAIINAEPCPKATRTVLPMIEANCSSVGFAKRTTGAQRLPHYDYGHRLPLWDTVHQSGFYTELGTMTPLVSSTDDAVAIIGPGEEIHLEFKAPLDNVHEAHTRRYVLETTGWCKDFDMYTKDGSTVGPLPTRGKLSEIERAKRQRLHQQYNTRFQSGG